MLPGFSLLWFLADLGLRAYVPPVLPPEPAFAATALRTVEVLPASGDLDAIVFARPHYMSPLVGSVARGTRLVVRGELAPPDGAYCGTGVYYAIEPYGWICSADAEPSGQPPTTEAVLQVVPGTSLPYRYARVMVPEGTSVPMWSSFESLRAHDSAERELARGDTIAVTSPLELFEGRSYYVTVDGKLVPVRGTTPVKASSEWQGVAIDSSLHLPFGWVTPNKASVYETPKGRTVEELAQRTRVEVLEEVSVGSTRWLRIGEGRYLKADQVNEVRKIERPLGTGDHAQWIDLDLGEQVVVAYRAGQPEFATLISSGRAPNNTPRGNYPVWGKITSITMKSQEYDDKPYYVNRVPWVLFFQAHNALHAAYWHDRFGVPKSHGCANLSPHDAQFIFDWLEPKLPAGWTSVRYFDLTHAPTVHVRNSKRAKPFSQERNVGPPDSADETERMEDALARREREAAAQSAAAARGVPLMLRGVTQPLSNAPGNVPLMLAP